ncbi:hypothetical protein Ancab_011951 [Ancistrocladus abbreviatus]
MQKYLKNNIAVLMKSDLDTNAYGRAEGLHVELNLSSCYDYVDECCVCISENLKVMQKQSECPEERKVAAASLMHAAARFADLPELRELRLPLVEKYRNVFVHFVDEEFAKKLKLNPPIMEVKFQLMQEIAQEFSITWDSTLLEQKLRTVAMTEEDQPSNFGCSNGKTKRYRLRRSEDEEVEEKGKQDHEDKQNDIKECSSTTMVRSRREENGSIKPLGSGVEVVNYKKPFPDRVFPAPYIKPKFDRSSTGMGGQKAQTVPLQHEDFQSGKNKNIENQTLDKVEEAWPRPRSVRSRFLRKPSGLTNASSSQISQNAEELSSGTCEQNARQQQRTMQEDPSERKDDGENLMDEVLIHYSTKHLKRNSTESPNSRLPELQDQDKGKVKSKLPLHPGRRSLSRKPELMSSLQSKPKHVRAASFQSDWAFRHVHPKLPDYDELAERIEALSKLKM